MAVVYENHVERGTLRSLEYITHRPEPASPLGYQSCRRPPRALIYVDPCAHRNMHRLHGRFNHIEIHHWGQRSGSYVTMSDKRRCP